MTYYMFGWWNLSQIWTTFGQPVSDFGQPLSHPRHSLDVQYRTNFGQPLSEIRQNSDNRCLEIDPGCPVSDNRSPVTDNRCPVFDHRCLEIDAGCPFLDNSCPFFRRTLFSASQMSSAPKCENLWKNNITFHFFNYFSPLSNPSGQPAERSEANLGFWVG